MVTRILLGPLLLVTIPLNVFIFFCLSIVSI
jgi:hypothetical protein